MKNLKRWAFALIALLAFIVAGSVHPVDAATSRVQAIKNRGYITVGLSADYAPLEFHATVDGQDKIVGADVSLAKKIAKDMGVKLQIKEMGFDALIGGLKTGKVDMVISGMSKTPERAKQVNFSKPYMYEKQIVVIRKSDKSKYKNVADFSGATVGAQKQTTQEAIAKAQLPGAKIHSLQKANDVVAQVSYNKLDAGVMSSIIAGAYVQKNKSLMMVDPHFATSASPTVVALPKGDTALTTQINKSIKSMQKQGLWKKYLDQAYTLQNQSQGFWAKYSGFFVKGALNTLLFALLTVIAGTVLGTILALMRRSKLWILKAISAVYVEFIRGTPLMVQAFIVFFGTQVLGLSLSAFTAGAIAWASTLGLCR